MIENFKLYAIGGLALLCAAAWFRGDLLKADRDRQKADKEVAVAANEAQSQTIAFLQSEIARLDAINIRLSERQLVITREAAQERAAVDNLAEERADVADFLSTPLPPDLAGVLFAEPDRDADRGDREPDPR